MASKYRSSSTVKSSRKAAKEQEKKRPGKYRSAWDKQIDEAMKAILNREDFHYNLNGDALYQQYKQQAIRDGRMAMLDTMGQASALTGGYANSYAQTVGQQAYQQQLSTLNDRIPELYAMALEQYRMQGDALQKQYDLYTDRDDRDYGRYQDNREAWQWATEQAWDRYNRDRDFDYNRYRDSVSDRQWNREFREARRRYDQEWEHEHPSRPAEPAPTTGGTGSAPAKTPDKKKNTGTSKAVLL